jgi:hypothetical protein
MKFIQKYFLRLNFTNEINLDKRRNVVKGVIDKTTLEEKKEN